MDLSKLPTFMLNKIKTSIFTLDDIKVYIDGLVSLIEAQDFYHGIIPEKRRDGTLATYNYHIQKIRIFYEMMLFEGRLEAKFLNHDNYILVTNIIIIEAIIHEIVHIYQNYCYHVKDYPLVPILMRQVEHTESMEENLYDYYYPYFTFERDAETVAIENVLVILRYLVKDTKLFIHYLDLLKTKIMAGYQHRDKLFYSPIEAIYQDLFQEESPEIKVEDTYDALKPGLKVSKRQYGIFKANYKSIIIDRNNLQIKL